MNCLVIFLVLQIACLKEAHGMWVFYETESVPIDRVLKNIETRLATNKNDVVTLYELARIHSMAYSTNLAAVDIMKGFDYPVFIPPSRDAGVPRSVTRQSDPKLEVVAKEHLANAISDYQRAAVLIFQGTNATAHRWFISPIQLGLAWSLDQAGRRDDAITAYRKALQRAWAVEVDRKPTIKEQLVWSWNQARAKKNPFTLPPKPPLGPGVCFSEEIIGYLLKLLDPVKDAKEIAQLGKNRQTLLTRGRAITPILVSLTDDTPLNELLNPAADVKFDLDGSGLPRRWGWITPKAAWLVFDEGSGKITSGLQMFGNATFWIFWRDGYAALEALDDDQDGVLRGDELRGISLWQDRNENGVCDPGEVRPVTDWGVAEINCSSQTHPTGIPFNPRGIVFRDGRTRPTFDWIAKSTGLEK